MGQVAGASALYRCSEASPAEASARLAARRQKLTSGLELSAVVFAIGGYLGLAVHGMSTTAATYDEPAHVSAAWTHLVLHDYRLSPDHPPLVKSLAAVPLLFLDVRMDTQDLAWRKHLIWRFARHWLYVWNDGARLLFWSRLPIVFLGALLLLAIFLWTRVRFGRGPASVAVILAAFSPDLLAHGRLVTTDLGAAAFIFFAVVALDALLRRPTPLRVVLSGLALGAALAAKMSAFALGPIFLALALARLFGNEPVVVPWGRRWRIERRAARAVALLVLLAVLVPIAVVTIWACYGFQGSFGADPALSASYPWDNLAASQPWVHGGIRMLRRAGLLPEPYLFGFLRFYEHSARRSAFLLGELSPRGFPHYFLVTFLVKTPLPLLFLVALACVLACTKQGRSRAQAGVLTCIIPVLVYAALTMTRGLNIGHRHLLPLYPFLFVLAGDAAVWLPRRLGRRGALALSLLVGWHAWGTLSVHPDELAYFNEAVGGASNGYRVLVDSNLDWGQDLARVETWMRDRGVLRYKLSYFGSASPRYHGISGQLLPSATSPRVLGVTREVAPGDILAVSATNLQGVYLDPEDQALMARLRRERPIGRIGYSILVYRADFRWPEPAVAQNTQ